MKKSLFEQIILYNYRYLIGYSLLVLVSVYSLFWRLGSLLPGLSGYEGSYLSTFDQSFNSVWSNPLYWPHKLLTQLSTNWLGSSELAYRLPTALLAAAGILVFFFIIRHRFQGRVAMIGILLLTTSSWWLAFARLARPEILIPVLIFFAVLFARLVIENKNGGWLIALAATIGVALYVPLLPYVIIIASIISYSLIKKTMMEMDRKWRLSFYAVLVLMCLPLIISFINEPSLARQWLSLPEAWPSLRHYLVDIKDSLASIFWASKAFPALNLGTLPYLDIFTVAMVVLGFYYLDHEVSRALTQFLIFGFVGLLLIVNLSPLPGDSVVFIPFVYTLVSAGIVMLFSQWYEIFPRNPVARMVVFLPTLALLFGVVWYHHTRYFIATPSSPETVEVFPPLSSALGQFYELNSAAGSTVVLVGGDEVNIADAVARTHDNSLVTTVGAAVVGQPAIAVTPAALAQVDADSLASLEKAGLTPLESSYASTPIVLWYTTSD